MSNRMLVLLPFFVEAFYIMLPLPQPSPLLVEPVWHSEPVHLLIGLPMLALIPLILAKLYLVLRTGELPNHILFELVAPTLWLIFFAAAAFYLGSATLQHRDNLIAYDFTSLIPSLGFAIVDFVFAIRLRRRYESIEV